MEIWRVLEGQNMKMGMWRILQGGGNMNMIYTAIVAVLLCAFFLKRKASMKGTPPGNLGWPLLGETIEFLAQQRNGNPQEFVKSRAAKYGNVFKTSLIGNPTVVFGGAEGNRFIFSNENKLVELYWPKSVRDIFSNSMFTTVGEEAKKIRKTLMTFLGPEALQNFVGITDSMVKSHLTMHWNAKEQVIVHPLLKKFTFSLFCNTFMSITDEKDVEELLLPFETLIAGIMQLPLNVPGTRYYKAVRSRDELVDIVGRHLVRRREALRRGECSRTQDLLSYLISRDNGLSEDQIKRNIILLMFAGHDTSTSTLTALIKRLAENPKCYAEFLQEQMGIASPKPKDEPLEWRDLQRMKYSWKAIQETLRLHPAAVGGFRKVIKEFTYQGYRIPKGWQAHWTGYSTQMSETYFENSESFDPDRFGDEGAVPYTFAPFGGGPRICPGGDFGRMEMLVFMHHLVNRFQWELVDADEKIVVDPMPVPTKGLPVKIIPRTSS